MSSDVFTAGQTLTDQELNTNALIGRVVARLYSDTAQSITQNTDTAIDFTDADLDVLGGWSSGDPSKYLPLVAGWYVLDGGVSMQSGTSITQLQAFAQENGTTNVLGSHAGIGTGGVANPSASMKQCLVALDGSTDYVELMARHNSSGAEDTATTLARRPILVVTYGGPL